VQAVEILPAQGHAPLAQKGTGAAHVKEEVGPGEALDEVGGRQLRLVCTACRLAQRRYRLALQRGAAGRSTQAEGDFDLQAQGLQVGRQVRVQQLCRVKSAGRELRLSCIKHETRLSELALKNGHPGGVEQGRVHAMVGSMFVRRSTVPSDLDL